ncbi:MAG: phosphoglycolate phosphatase [Alphaproteobacteria bacterium]|nr:phosphoglycolate phosphatase [Alphaproteobacteria bacterium]
MKRPFILFDLDGTLVDSLPDLAHALNLQLAEAGLRALGESEVRLMIGDGAKKLVERAFAAAGRSLPSDPAPAIARFIELYENGPAQRTTVYPGVLETLADLRQAGLHLAVVTNKPQNASLKVLAGLGLSQFFDAVVGAGASPALKPDPAPLKAALDLMQASPDQAIMVGDNANDVAAARALGIPVIVVTYGYARSEPAQLGADALIDVFGDLPQALDHFTSDNFFSGP